METPTRNAQGLFDAPIRLPGRQKPTITLTQQAIEQQLEAGAFLLRRDEAIERGFINPHDEPDSVIVYARQEAL